MYALINGKESPERVAVLIEITRLKSEPIKAAIYDCLCRGVSKPISAKLNQVPQQNLNRALKRLNALNAQIEEVKEFDWARFKKEIGDSK